MSVEIVGRTEQTLEFHAVGVDVFPRDDRRFRDVVKNGRNVLRLKIFRNAFGAMVSVNRRQRKQCQQHDCCEHDRALRCDFFSRRTTHHLLCRLRPL